MSAARWPRNTSLLTGIMHASRVSPSSPRLRRNHLRAAISFKGATPMRDLKNLKYVFFLLALLAFASPIFAQAPAGAPAVSTDWNRAAAGISMAIASGLCALGQ